MKKRIKDMWLEALRSGKYKQGKNQLKNGNSNFCCLGVLCDLHAKETGGAWADNPISSGYKKYKGAQVFLPKPVIEWAGLIARDGQPKNRNMRFIGEGGRTTSLALMNDGVRSPQLGFEQLANIIEKYL